MDENLYTGIDIGKSKCIAGFVSTSLLAKRKRFEACPTLPFEQSRTGFEKLLATMTAHVPLEHCIVLLERTGHYHRPLVEFLLEQGVAVYWMHVQKQLNKMLKSDRYDALLLANTLYSQLALGVQVADKREQVRRVYPPLPVAAELRGLVRRRYELVQSVVRELNRLTAIKDEIFPEFTEIFTDCNGATALSVREHFPTPTHLVAASLDELRVCKIGRRPSDDKLLLLQELARTSIGVKNPATLAVVAMEQQQMITELRLLRKHLAAVEAQITTLVESSRQGQILMSIPPIGAIQAGILLAHIEHIANFPNAAALKGYCGWAPKQAQTGTSYDSSNLAKSGNRQLKRCIYLITMLAVQKKMKTEWGLHYEEMLPRKCVYDERKGDYEGKLKALGHIAGSIVTTIYALLRHDHETLSSLKEGEEVPAPLLYEQATHHAHRSGAYRSLACSTAIDPEHHRR